MLDQLINYNLPPTHPLKKCSLPLIGYSALTCDRSKAKMPSTFVLVMRHCVGSIDSLPTFSNTGGLRKFWGNRKKDVKVSVDDVRIQWISEIRVTNELFTVTLGKKWCKLDLILTFSRFYQGWRNQWKNAKLSCARALILNWDFVKPASAPHMYESFSGKIGKTDYNFVKIIIKNVRIFSRTILR